MLDNSSAFIETNMRKFTWLTLPRYDSLSVGIPSLLPELD